MAMRWSQRYGTHIPILLKAVEVTHGPILELGCGLNSTPFLYWLCKDQDRKFVSYDNSRLWIATVGYPVEYINDWDKAYIDKTHWSIALIDHKPGERRRIDVKRLKDKADFVILHDSEPELNRFYGYKEIYPLFKYRFDYTKFLPNTTVVSNFVNLEKILKMA
jgi:hypothetical protein